MDIHSELFEEVLAEALRAGPGSPQWREAVDTLRAAGQEGEDYAMLCRAREDLASGREYRSVRAGQGFTQKLMQRIDREQTPRWNIPTANIVTTVALLVVAVIAIIACWVLFTPKSAAPVSHLQDTLFATPLVNENFTTASPAALTRIGMLPVTIDNGAKVDVLSRAGDQHIGGGFYVTAPLSPDEPYAVESAIQVSNPKNDLIAQVFISDRKTFADNTGITPHEIVCLVEQGKLRVVLPDGRTVSESALQGGADAEIRLRIDRSIAIVELNGRSIWTGAHDLALDQPRHAGIRFLARGGEQSTGVSFRYLRLLKP